MKQAKTVVTMFVLLACFTVVLAQSADCPALVETALANVHDLCEQTGRDQACYGNSLLEAQLRSIVTDVSFEEPGDQVAVGELQTLRSAPVDLSDDQWGVALFRILADLPDTLPGQAVTLIMFGGTRVENAVPSTGSAPAPELTTEIDSVLRAAPSNDGQIVGALIEGDSVTILGKTADSLWLRVEMQDADQRRGWIPVTVVGTVETTTMPILDPNALPPSPMQAFYLKPSFTGLSCAEAPDGMLVQTPDTVEGLRVALTVNEVQISLGSTAFLQIGGDGGLVINVLEGLGQVQSNGVSVDVPAGYRTHVPLDTDFRAIGAPASSEPYDVGQLGYLPLDLLPETISPESAVWTIGQSLCVNQAGGAWMRGTPSSLDQTVVMILVNGAPVAVNGDPQFDGVQSWLPVRTGNTNGWVEQSSLTPCQQVVPPPCTPRTDWLYIYVVKPGDYLAQIAQASGVTVSDLAAANCLNPSATLFSGTQLRVPRAPVVATVAPALATAAPLPTTGPQPATTPDTGLVDFVPPEDVISGNIVVSEHIRDCNNGIRSQNQTYYLDVSPDHFSITLSGGSLSNADTLVMQSQTGGQVTLRRGGTASDIYSGEYGSSQIAFDPYLFNGVLGANLYIDAICDDNSTSS